MKTREANEAKAIRVRVQRRGRESIVLRYKGVEYHVGDYVYLCKPQQKAARLLKVAKITEIGLKGSTIRAHRFVRDLDHPSGDHSVRMVQTFQVVTLRLILLLFQQRRVALFMQGGNNRGGSNVDITRLAGKCQVIHSDDWYAREDVQDGSVFMAKPHLYHVDEMVTTPGLKRRRRPLDRDILAPCRLCKESPRQDPPLVMMDVFCGAGGMSQGFVQAGVAKAAYGIDVSPSACATFQLVHHSFTLL